MARAHSAGLLRIVSLYRMVSEPEISFMVTISLIELLAMKRKRTYERRNTANRWQVKEEERRRIINFLQKKDVIRKLDIVGPRYSLESLTDGSNETTARHLVHDTVCNQARQF